MTGANDGGSLSAGKGDSLGAPAKKIIEMFGPGKSRLTVADAARESDITRAAARRCLLTLGELGYLAHDRKFFSRRLACGDWAGDPGLAKISWKPRNHLDALRGQLKESVSLAILEG